MRNIRLKIASIILPLSMLVSFSTLAINKKHHDYDTHLIVEIWTERGFNFFNSGVVKSNCNHNDRHCRFVSKSDLARNHINKAWSFKKKSKYFSNGDKDRMDAVIYAKSKGLSEMDVYCAPISEDEKHVAVLRFNRHLIGYQKGKDRSATGFCSGIGIEVPAFLYGEVGEIMPTFFGFDKESYSKIR